MCGRSVRFGILNGIEVDGSRMGGSSDNGGRAKGGSQTGRAKERRAKAKKVGRAAESVKGGRKVSSSKLYIAYKALLPARTGRSDQSSG